MYQRVLRCIMPGALTFATLLSGCGGGSDAAAPVLRPSIEQFTADRPGYFVGEEARLSVVYANGAGRIEPGAIPIASGATITTPALARSTSYRLVVSDGRATVERSLELAVHYRDRVRAIDMPFARAQHTACVLHDGRVLILGGEDGGYVLPEATYVFDPTTEAFTEFVSLSSGRIGFVAVTLADGNVLVAGGAKGLTQAPEAEVIDVHRGAVKPTANVPDRKRHAATATLLRDGRVLIAGGLTHFGADETAEIYDPMSMTFTLLPVAMAKGRFAHTAVVLESGRVLIYGGFTNDARRAPPEIYDPETSTFAVLDAPEDTVRGNHAAVSLSDGSVWIVGGEDLDGVPWSSVLRFDAGSLTFARMAPLATPRTFFYAAPLTDVRVLAVGGATTSVPNGSVTDTIEILSAPGSRRDGPIMNTPRSFQSVTQLANGKVLIAGGLDGNLVPLASAEIFE